MACLNLGWLEQLLIWLVVIAAVVAIVRLLLPIVIGPLGVAGATVTHIMNILIWAIVAIAVIVLVFDLLTCALGVPHAR